MLGASSTIAATAQRSTCYDRRSRETVWKVSIFANRKPYEPVKRAKETLPLPCCATKTHARDPIGRLSRQSLEE
jgi:hypothetical protein